MRQVRKEAAHIRVEAAGPRPGLRREGQPLPGPGSLAAHAAGPQAAGDLRSRSAAARLQGGLLAEVAPAVAARPAGDRAVSARAGRSRVKPHQLAADRDFPADHAGRQRCTVCGLMGKTGDPHHPESTITVPRRRIAPALIEAAAQREAAILGEKEDLE
jgi:hypothetical protein